MVLIRQRPLFPELARWEGLTEPPTRFARILDQFFTPTRSMSEALSYVPVVNLVEKDNELVLTAELPGMTDTDVQLEVDNNILTLKGEKKTEHEEKGEQYHCWERSFGSFERSFGVPSSVDLEKIKAEFKDGVLEVHMPKTAEAKGRKITIATKAAQ